MEISKIHPLPKKSLSKVLNDYRPIASMWVLKKGVEYTIQDKFLKFVHLDSNQFAYTT